MVHLGDVATVRLGRLRVHDSDARPGGIGDGPRAVLSVTAAASRPLRIRARLSTKCPSLDPSATSSLPPLPQHQPRQPSSHCSRRRRRRRCRRETYGASQSIICRAGINILAAVAHFDGGKLSPAHFLYFAASCTSKAANTFMKLLEEREQRNVIQK